MMSIPVDILTPDGQLKPAPFEADSLAEVAQQEPEGVYTVTRTYKRDQAVLLEAHFDRLEESAELVQIPFQFNRQAVRQSLRQMIHRTNFQDSRFRITLPREQPDQVLLAVEPLQIVSAELRRQGVRVATLPITRRNPRAKTNNWIAQRTQAQRSLAADVYECITVNDIGELIEGFSSNFYAIKDGCLYTAKRGMLHGIARRIVLTIAEEVLPLNFAAIKRTEIPNLQEAFLTSSSRGILAIIAIDGHMVGQGEPGQITAELAARYDRWVEEHLEPI